MAIVIKLLIQIISYEVKCLIGLEDDDSNHIETTYKDNKSTTDKNFEGIDEISGENEGRHKFKCNVECDDINSQGKSKFKCMCINHIKMKKKPILMSKLSLKKKILNLFRRFKGLFINDELYSEKKSDKSEFKNSLKRLQNINFKQNKNPKNTAKESYKNLENINNCDEYHLNNSAEKLDDISKLIRISLYKNPLNLEDQTNLEKQEDQKIQENLINQSDQNYKEKLISQDKQEELNIEEHQDKHVIYTEQEKDKNKTDLEKLDDYNSEDHCDNRPKSILEDEKNFTLLSTNPLLKNLDYTNDCEEKIKEYIKNLCEKSCIDMLKYISKDNIEKVLSKLQTKYASEIFNMSKNEIVNKLTTDITFEAIHLELESHLTKIENKFYNNFSNNRKILCSHKIESEPLNDITSNESCLYGKILSKNKERYLMTNSTSESIHSKFEHPNYNNKETDSFSYGARDDETVVNPENNLKNNISHSNRFKLPLCICDFDLLSKKSKYFLHDKTQPQLSGSVKYSSYKMHIKYHEFTNNLIKLVNNIKYNMKNPNYEFRQSNIKENSLNNELDNIKEQIWSKLNEESKNFFEEQNSFEEITSEIFIDKYFEYNHKCRIEESILDPNSNKHIESHIYIRSLNPTKKTLVSKEEIKILYEMFKSIPKSNKQHLLKTEHLSILDHIITVLYNDFSLQATYQKEEKSIGESDVLYDKLEIKNKDEHNFCGKNKLIRNIKDILNLLNNRDNDFLMNLLDDVEKVLLLYEVINVLKTAQIKGWIGNQNYDIASINTENADDLSLKEIALYFKRLPEKIYVLMNINKYKNNEFQKSIRKCFKKLKNAIENNLYNISSPISAFDSFCNNISMYFSIQAATKSSNFDDYNDKIESLFKTYFFRELTYADLNDDIKDILKTIYIEFTYYNETTKVGNKLLHLVLRKLGSCAYLKDLFKDCKEETTKIDIENMINCSNMIPEITNIESNDEFDLYFLEESLDAYLFLQEFFLLENHFITRSKMNASIIKKYMDYIIESVKEYTVNSNGKLDRKCIIVKTRCYEILLSLNSEYYSFCKNNNRKIKNIEMVEISNAFTFYVEYFAEFSKSIATIPYIFSNLEIIFHFSLSIVHYQCSLYDYISIETKKDTPITNLKYLQQNFKSGVRNLFSVLDKFLSTEMTIKIDNEYKKDKFLQLLQNFIIINQNFGYIINRENSFLNSSRTNSRCKNIEKTSKSEFHTNNYATIKSFILENDKFQNPFEHIIYKLMFMKAKKCFEENNPNTKSLKKLKVSNNKFITEIVNSLMNMFYEFSEFLLNYANLGNKSSENKAKYMIEDLHKYFEAFIKILEITKSDKCICLHDFDKNECCEKILVTLKKTESMLYNNECENNTVKNIVKHTDNVLDNENIGNDKNLDPEDEFKNLSEYDDNQLSLDLKDGLDFIDTSKEVINISSINEETSKLESIILSACKIMILITHKQILCFENDNEDFNFLQYNFTKMLNDYIKIEKDIINVQKICNLLIYSNEQNQSVEIYKKNISCYKSRIDEYKNIFTSILENIKNNLKIMILEEPNMHPQVRNYLDSMEKQITTALYQKNNFYIARMEEIIKNIKFNEQNTSLMKKHLLLFAMYQNEINYLNHYLHKSIHNDDRDKQPTFLVEFITKNWKLYESFKIINQDENLMGLIDISIKKLINESIQKSANIDLNVLKMAFLTLVKHEVNIRKRLFFYSDICSN